MRMKLKMSNKEDKDKAMKILQNKGVNFMTVEESNALNLDAQDSNILTLLAQAEIKYERV